ncbi:MAG: nickel transporter [Hyphomicrobium sp.]|nr:nickel transporter [Hyphomicrobium sp.]
MDVIPVIDVAKGTVVRAVQGHRAAYQPLVTPHANSADPAAVAQGLRRLYPFRKFYVADLDGIEGRGRNVHLVPSLSRVLGGAEIWIDAGTASRGAARALLAAPIATLVVGSESLETLATANDILAESPQRTVLSLDFRGDEFMGPSALLRDEARWPDRLIVMTLARVGSDQGPDIDRLRDVVSRAHGRKVYAAGGIRDVADLAAVRHAGAHGALIASALHGQKISAGDLKEIAGR